MRFRTGPSRLALLTLALAVTRCAGSSDTPPDAGSGAPDAAAAPDAGATAPDAEASPDAEPAPDAAAPDAAPRDTGVRAAYEWESLPVPDQALMGRWGVIVADRGDGTALLFGGTNVDSTGGGVFGDTWLLDARDPDPVFSPVEVEGPVPRYCGCMTWDPVRRRGVLFGGRNARFSDTAPETWIFDPDVPSWTRAQPTTSPFGVIGCAMAYAPTTDAIYLFGGASERRGFSGDTWRFDLDAGEWTKLVPGAGATLPAARYDSALHCLGGQCDKLVLFGGAGASGNRPAPHDDVWTFDPALETWTEITASSTVTPGGRRTPFVGVEPSGEHLVIGMGVLGLDGSGPYSDLWRFELATGIWEHLAPLTPPTARGFALALPGGTGAIGLLLGGTDATAPARELYRLWPPSDGRWP